jgi:predicted nucleic acid-binding protein
MIVIADSSALIALATCNALDLLVDLFDQVVVPKKVYEECIIEDKPQSFILKTFLADKVDESQTTYPLQLPANLGMGETEAMLLYFELKADYLLMDDNRARKAAKLNKINVIGSLGFLLIAKKAGKIDQVSSYLDKLTQSNLYIDTELMAKVRKLANE